MPGPKNPLPFHPKDVRYSLRTERGATRELGAKADTASSATAVFSVDHNAATPIVLHPPPRMWHPINEKLRLRVDPVVGVARTFAVTCATSSSAKAPVGVKKSCIAKAATSSSIKAPLSRVQRLLAKVQISSSGKAPLARSQRLIVTLSTATSSKATTTTLLHRLLVRAATATGTVATLTVPSITTPIITTTTGGASLGRRGPWYPDRIPEQVLREEEEIMVMI